MAHDPLRLHPRDREALSDWVYRRKWLYYPMQVVRGLLALLLLGLVLFGLGWLAMEYGRMSGWWKGW